VRVLPQPERVLQVWTLFETYPVELPHRLDKGIWLLQPPVEPLWYTRHQPDEVEMASNLDAVSAVQVEVVLAEAVLVGVVQEAVVETTTTTMTMTTKAVPFPPPDAWIKTV